MASAPPCFTFGIRMKLAPSLLPSTESIGSGAKNQPLPYQPLPFMLG